MADNNLDIDFKNTTGLKLAIHALISERHRFDCWFDADKDCWVMRVNNLDAHNIAHMEAFKYNSEPEPTKYRPTS